MSLQDFLSGVRDVGGTGEVVAQSYRTIVDKVSGGTPLVRPVPGYVPATQDQPQVSTVAAGESLPFKMPAWGWWALSGLGLTALAGGLYWLFAD